MSLSLHKERLLRIPFRGKRLVSDLEQRANETKQAALAVPIGKGFGVSVVIRTKNDAASIGALLDDIKANQEYFAGPVQIVLVDTQSTDDTLQIAKRYGKCFELTLVPITQAEFNYAKSLNVGFEAAKYNDVLTLVGHSSLSNKATLLVAQRYSGAKELAGMFSVTLPDSNASLTERLMAAVGHLAGVLVGPASPVVKARMGLMAANCSMVRRDVWQKLGGYDERYAAGGEDGDFGRRAMAAGLTIMQEPALAVHHTHGLGFVKSVKQLLYWRKIAKPLAFSAAELARYRDDLDLPAKS